MRESVRWAVGTRGTIARGDGTGSWTVLPSVTEAERRILAKGATKLYRPIDGDAAYRAAVQGYVFGEGHELATSGRVAVSQTPGGTGGLRVAADFLRGGPMQSGQSLKAA